MAKPTAFSKFLIILIALALIVFGLSKAGLLDKIIPKGREKEDITRDDFSDIVSGEGTTPTTHAPNEPLGVSKSKLNRPIKVGIVTWPGYTGGLVANNGATPNKNCIYWKKYGIQVEFIIIEDTAQNRQAFTSGNTDIMWSTTDFFAAEYPELIRNGIDAKIILQNDWSRGGDGIVVKKNINNVEDLAGKKIATTELTPSHFFLLYLLSQSNLTTEEINEIRNNLVFVGSAPLAAKAFSAGEVDAAVTWEPDLTQAADLGNGKKLATTKTITNLIADVMVARADFIEQYPSEVLSFVNGWFDGVDKFHENPEAAYPVVSDALMLDYQTTKEMTESIRVTNFADNKKFFALQTNTPSQYEAIFKSASKIWRKEHLIDQIARPADAVDLRFLYTLIPKYPDAIAEQAFDFSEKPAENAKALLTKTTSIHFPSGSSQISPDSKYILDEVGETLMSIANAYVRIEGNTDSDGDAEYNRRLSLQRATACKNYLVDKFGINPDRFIVIGNGEDKPVASNATEEGKQKNRRTDFIIIGKE